MYNYITFSQKDIFCERLVNTESYLNQDAIRLFCTQNGIVPSKLTSATEIVYNIMGYSVCMAHIPAR